MGPFVGEFSGEPQWELRQDWDQPLRPLNLHCLALASCLNIGYPQIPVVLYKKKPIYPIFLPIGQYFMEKPILRHFQVDYIINPINDH